jgi:hypothetical protein
VEESQKKALMVGITVLCLVLAGLITYKTRKPDRYDFSKFKDKMTWVTCRNPDCYFEYQISLQEYFEYVEENQDPGVKWSSKRGLNAAITMTDVLSAVLAKQKRIDTQQRAVNAVPRGPEHGRYFTAGTLGCKDNRCVSLLLGPQIPTQEHLTYQVPLRLRGVSWHASDRAG